MNIPHDKFCVLPWISLEASPIGTVRPCCIAKHELTNDENIKYNLNTDDLNDVIDCNDLKQLRKDFLDQKKPAMCSRCWDEEDSGRTSKRMHTLNRLEDILQDHNKWTEEGKELIFLDLKLGNICNLKCRICGSWSSSTFAGEEIKATYKADRPFCQAKQMNDMGAWPRKNESNFWQRLNENAPNIRYLEFTGGEPFMIKEHFEFLKTLIDMGVSKDIEIHYNTNGTIYPEQAEDIWKEFKHVEIAFSIDAVGEKFEYQRTNAKWAEVLDNIEMFKKLRKKLNNITLQVCCTINIYNVFYLDEVAEWIDKQDFDFVYWNMLHDAEINCITSLTPTAKNIAYKKLTLSQSNHVEEFKRVAEFMNSKNTSSDSVIKNIKELDKRRGHDLSKDHPELASTLIFKDNDKIVQKIKMLIHYDSGGGGHWLWDIISSLETGDFSITQAKPSQNTDFAKFDWTYNRSKNIVCTHIYTNKNGLIVSHRKNDKFLVDTNKVVKLGTKYSFNVLVNGWEKSVRDGFVPVEQMDKWFINIRDEVTAHLENRSDWVGDYDLDLEWIYNDKPRFVKKLYSLLDESRIKYHPNDKFIYDSMENWISTNPPVSLHFNNWESVLWLGWGFAVVDFLGIKMEKELSKLSLKEVAEELKPHSEVIKEMVRTHIIPGTFDG